MPSFNGQGQSYLTEAKERGLAAAFEINISIFKAKMPLGRRATYCHFDLNSGGGMNEEAHCIGSPLAFLHAAQRKREDRYFAAFVDIDRRAVSQLLNREGIVGNKRCHVFHGDNRDFIDTIPDLVARYDRPQWAIGSILADPNGADIPIGKIAKVATICPRLDVFINWNSTGYKRQQGTKGTLKEAIEEIGKRYWLIRAPIGMHQFTLLLGRNVEVGDHKSLGFYHLDSPHGRAILDRCNYTRDELAQMSSNAQRKLLD